MPKLPRSTSSATSSMASGTIPSRPAKPHPDRLKIMHLFPDRPLAFVQVGMTPAGPVVVPKPPPRDVERGEAAAAARSPGESRRLAQASAAGGPARSEMAAEGPPRPAGAADAPAREPTLFEVKSAPMTIDLSRFREAR